MPSGYSTAAACCACPKSCISQKVCFANSFILWTRMMSNTSWPFLDHSTQNSSRRVIRHLETTVFFFFFCRHRKTHLRLFAWVGSMFKSQFMEFASFHHFSNLLKPLNRACCHAIVYHKVRFAFVHLNQTLDPGTGPYGMKQVHMALKCPYGKKWVLLKTTRSHVAQDHF